MSLGDAREWLRERVEHGARCPCCTQFAKVYERKLNSRMARQLITFWWEDWFHVPVVELRDILGCP